MQKESLCTVVCLCLFDFVDHHGPLGPSVPVACQMVSELTNPDGSIRPWQVGQLPQSSTRMAFPSFLPSLLSTSKILLSGYWVGGLCFEAQSVVYGLPNLGLND